MDLEGILLNEINQQRKTNAVRVHYIYISNPNKQTNKQTKKLIEAENRMAVDKRKCWSKRTNF